MLETWYEWVILIVGVIVTGFCALGVFIFALIEKRIDFWFVCGLVGGIIVICLGLFIL